MRYLYKLIKINIMIRKLLIIITLFCFTKSYAQTHIYKFNGVFDDSGGGGGPTLTEVFDVTSGCIPGGTAGAFVSQLITTSACTRGPQQVFSFNQNSGLSYPNTTFIGGTYTIHMLYKINDYTQGSFSFQRVIDFKNSVTDDGLYTRDKGGGIGSLAYAAGGSAVNIPSNLIAGRYYLITLVRDASTLPDPTITIYLDGTAVLTGHSDAAGIYASASVPIIFFMDDQSSACETSTGAVRYISISDGASDATAVQATWINICNGLLKPGLNSFVAQKNNNDARLQWQSGNETNTSYFDIERSYNGQTYTAIGRLNATNISGNNYTYTDHAVFSSSNVTAFYRLKIADNNGSYEYSSAVKLTNSKSTTINIFPNPAVDAISISGLDADALIRLISIDGKVLLQETAGAESRIIHIEKYQSGTYIIQVQNNKETIQKKFVKQ
jgi:hypothetical protein